MTPQRRPWIGICLAFALVLGCLTVPATAQESESEDLNVRITLRVSQVVEGKAVPVRSYDLVAAANAGPSELLSGQRVPFPVKEDQGDGKGTGMHYVYQNVGFTVRAEVRPRSGDKVLLIADIEDSRVVAGEGGAPPTVETRQLNVSAVLTDGTPLRLTEVEVEGELGGFVEVTATILD